MKIWYNCSSAMGYHESHKDYYNATKEHAQTVLGPEVEVAVHGVNRPEFELEVASSYFEFLAKGQVINNVIKAEREGFDAAVLGCFLDPGLFEAREVVDIPVIGAGEASMLFACMLGLKFGLVIYNPSRLTDLERRIRIYGLEHRVASIGLFNISPKRLLVSSFKEPDPVIEKFLEAAKRTVEKGADIVIPACTGLNVLLMRNNVHRVNDTGVPVLDCVGVALKIAKTIVELKDSSGLFVSRKYPSPPRRMVEKLRKFYKLDNGE